LQEEDAREVFTASSVSTMLIVSSMRWAVTLAVTGEREGGERGLVDAGGVDVDAVERGDRGVGRGRLGCLCGERGGEEEGKR